MTEGASDAALLAAVGDRDLPALRELYARHAPWLTVRLSRRCGDAEAVADALQDTRSLDASSEAHYGCGTRPPREPA